MSELTRQSYPYIARLTIDVYFRAEDNDTAFGLMRDYGESVEAELAEAMTVDGAIVSRRELHAGPLDGGLKEARDVLG